MKCGTAVERPRIGGLTIIENICNLCVCKVQMITKTKNDREKYMDSIGERDRADQSAIAERKRVFFMNQWKAV